MQKIIPNLWFDANAEEAAKFYVSVFSGRNLPAKIGRVMRYGKSGAEVSGMPEGTVMTIEWELDGQKFVGINGGPAFKFSEAVSFLINCNTQEEIDYFWAKLTEGGEESVCGWLKDKYGLSWQIAPEVLDEMIQNPEKGEKAMKVMLKMKKLDIKALEEAYNA